MGWFSKLKSQYRTIATSAPLVLQNTLGTENQPQLPPLKRHLQTQSKRQIHWNLHEMSALHAAQEHAHLCYSPSDGDRPLLQSLVLGFDLEHEQILLDEFFPALPPGLLDENITLTLPTAFGILRFEVLISERVTLAGSPALVGNILDKSFLNDRREKKRVVFAAQQAPTVEILLPMTPVIKAQIVNLSEDGLLVSYSANTKPKIYLHHGECKMAFGKHFTFKAKIKIKEMHYHRRPFRHTMIRIVFQSLDAYNRDQLVEFIHQLVALDEGLRA